MLSTIMTKYYLLNRPYLTGLKERKKISYMLKSTGFFINPHACVGRP